MSATTYFAHVPVDEFNIIRGPGGLSWCAIPNQIAHEMRWHAQTSEPHCVEVSMLLATTASAKTFRRTLRIANVYEVLGNESHFTGYFSGQPVSGEYNTKTRHGRFTFD